LGREDRGNKKLQWIAVLKRNLSVWIVVIQTTKYLLNAPALFFYGVFRFFGHDYAAL
jgi:hypothetical protein